MFISLPAIDKPQQAGLQAWQSLHGVHWPIGRASRCGRTEHLEFKPPMATAFENFISTPFFAVRANGETLAATAREGVFHAPRTLAFDALLTTIYRRGLISWC